FLVSLLVLLVCAHIGVRKFAPGASPLLLPLATLLHGIGYVMIARLSDRLAGLQATWSLIAVACFIAVLVVVRRVADLLRYQYTFLLLGVFLQLLPLVPGVGFSSGGARIWVSIGPINFQPGEFAKLCLAIFFAGYLAEQREVLVRATRSVEHGWQAHCWCAVARDAHVLAGDACVGRECGGDGGRKRFRFVTLVLYVVCGVVVGGNRAQWLHRFWWRALCARCVHCVQHVWPCARSLFYLARPVEPVQRQGVPNCAGHVWFCRRWHVGNGFRFG
ncbi:MAG: hypothetical protein EBY23_12795, partial [Actinobacteria bacterium]|nr:hypothetical protein [Actinomycetota bacterium]